MGRNQGHRLPSGFGSIRNLGAGRTRPYAVHPPAVKVKIGNDGAGATEDTEVTGVAGVEEATGAAGAERACGEPCSASTIGKNMIWKRPPAICYVSSWESGLKILALYHAGFYKEGMEDLIDGGDPLPVPESKDVLCEYCNRVLADIEKIKNGETPNMTTQSPGTAETATDQQTEPLTFQQVYNAFHDYKYGSHAQRQLSQSTKNATNAAYKRFNPFFSLPLDKITVDELQDLVNEVADEGYSKSTVSRMVTLTHQLWRYAYPRGLCSKENGKYVEMPKAKDETHHQDFTDEELAKLWKEYRESKDPVVRMILIMCYSGYRVGEYEAEDFRVFDDYFQGGFKTDAGRNRIVPIHSGIKELVEEIKEKTDKVVGRDAKPAHDSGGAENKVEHTVSFFCGNNSDQFREDMKAKLVDIGIDGVIVDGIERYHTPHSCRHTFSRLCESYGVNEADRKRMMGHSFRGDITNGVYGHRSVAELKEQIEKIKNTDEKTAA